MKAFTISAAFAVLLAQAHASPMKAETRQFEAQITFQGAPPQAAAFSVSVPTDGNSFIILNPLSISHISSLGGATCTFFGIDGSETTVVGAQTVDVGPPQTQTFGACRAL